MRFIDVSNVASLRRTVRILCLEFNIATFDERLVPSNAVVAFDFVQCSVFFIIHGSLIREKLVR